MGDYNETLYVSDIEEEVCESYKKRRVNIDVIDVVSLVISIIAIVIAISANLYTSNTSKPIKTTEVSPTSIGYEDGVTTVSVLGDGWSEDNDNYYLDVSDIISNESNDIAIKYTNAGVYYGKDADLIIKITS